MVQAAAADVEAQAEAVALEALEAPVAQMAIMPPHTDLAAAALPVRLEQRLLKRAAMDIKEL
jgi:hypothetical protein